MLAPTRLMYARSVLIDTSAVVALHDPNDQYHAEARGFFPQQARRLRWYCLSVTKHETFTTTRYTRGLSQALTRYRFLHEEPFRRLDFSIEDEDEAERILRRHTDQKYSYHDALCAAVMKREGILNIFTFDSDFWTMGLGFVILPGRT
jgi:predicted nucleic acid-binding protein